MFVSVCISCMTLHPNKHTIQKLTPSNNFRELSPLPISFVTKFISNVTWRSLLFPLVSLTNVRKSMQQKTRGTLWWISPLVNSFGKWHLIDFQSQTLFSMRTRTLWSGEGRFGQLQGVWSLSSLTSVMCFISLRITLFRSFYSFFPPSRIFFVCAPPVAFPAPPLFFKDHLFSSS